MLLAHRAFTAEISADCLLQRTYCLPAGNPVESVAFLQHRAGIWMSRGSRTVRQIATAFPSFTLEVNYIELTKKDNLTKKCIIITMNYSLLSPTIYLIGTILANLL